MAIKISGTDVIDNSRNIVNATNGTFSGTVTAPTFSGTITPQQSGYKFFSSPGTFVVGTDCPSAITKVKITGCGGGGAGGNGGASSGSGSGAGGGGGGIAPVNVMLRDVSNGQTYTVTVGGSAGNTTVTLPGPTAVYTFNAGQPGPAGQNATPTTVGTFVTGGSAGAATPGNTFSYAGYPINPVYPGPGALGAGRLSQSAQAVPVVGGSGGDGGVHLMGMGGSAAQALAAGSNGSAQAGSGYGSGGGGGAGARGTPTPTAATPGAAGSPGFVLIEW